MITLGKRLTPAAKEARSIACGEADPAIYRVSVPAEIEVKAIRRKPRMPQAEFSVRYGFPFGTLRDWEQAGGQYDTSARVFLLITAPGHEAADRALHAA